MTCLYLLKRTRIKEAQARTLDIEQWAHYHHVSMSVGCFFKAPFPFASLMKFGGNLQQFLIIAFDVYRAK